MRADADFRNAQRRDADGLAVDADARAARARVNVERSCSKPSGWRAPAARRRWPRRGARAPLQTQGERLLRRAARSARRTPSRPRTRTGRRARCSFAAATYERQRGASAPAAVDRDAGAARRGPDDQRAGSRRRRLRGRRTWRRRRRRRWDLRRAVTPGARLRCRRYGLLAELAAGRGRIRGASPGSPGGRRGRGGRRISGDSRPRSNQPPPAPSASARITSSATGAAERPGVAAFSSTGACPARTRNRTPRRARPALVPDRAARRLASRLVGHHPVVFDVRGSIGGSMSTSAHAPRGHQGGSGTALAAPAASSRKSSATNRSASASAAMSPSKVREHRGDEGAAASLGRQLLLGLVFVQLGGDVGGGRFVGVVGRPTGRRPGRQVRGSGTQAARQREPRQERCALAVRARRSRVEGLGDLAPSGRFERGGKGRGRLIARRGFGVHGAREHRVQRTIQMLGVPAVSVPICRRSGGPAAGQQLERNRRQREDVGRRAPRRCRQCARARL